MDLRERQYSRCHLTQSKSDMLRIRVHSRIDISGKKMCVGSRPAFHVKAVIRSGWVKMLERRIPSNLEWPEVQYVDEAFTTSSCRIK